MTYEEKFQQEMEALRRETIERQNAARVAWEQNPTRENLRAYLATYGIIMSY